MRGGAPGTRETDLMRPGNIVERVHAIVLAGGSAFGLDAATGVMRYLLEHKRGYAFGRAIVPIVPAAILYDLGIGRHDRWPDADAGYRAAASARARTLSPNNSRMWVRGPTNAIPASRHARANAALSLRKP